MTDRVSKQKKAKKHLINQISECETLISFRIIIYRPLLIYQDPTVNKHKPIKKNIKISKYLLKIKKL